MRIISKKIDLNVQLGSNSNQSTTISRAKLSEKNIEKVHKSDKKVISNGAVTSKEQIKEISKDKVQQAVDSINEFIAPLQTNTKFIYHEGLDEYYVKVVDSVTEEVIKEIPPERLLNAFYEMQKLAGMIVDEKI